MPQPINGATAEQLRTIIQRIERLAEEKAAIGADITEIYAEAKGNGYDVKALRRITGSASASVQPPVKYTIHAPR